MSQIVLKGYKLTTKESVRVIYDGNKEAIGCNPVLARPGQILKTSIEAES